MPLSLLRDFGPPREARLHPVARMEHLQARLHQDAAPIRQVL